MTREIKFRLILSGKIVGYEKWYPGKRREDETCEAFPCWLYSKDGEYWNPTYIFHERKEQFNGLLDKNGKEIYEGDIIEFEDTGETDGETKEGFDFINRAAIVFVEGRFALSNLMNENGGAFDEIDDHDEFIWLVRGSTKIGNIHENADLLREDSYGKPK